jgi:hypothetical protein
MTDKSYTSRVDVPFDLNKYRQKAGTPAGKLLERGANPADAKVGGVVAKEAGFLGSVMADEKMKGGMKQVVDHSRGAYKEAITALPSEIRDAIGIKALDLDEEAQGKSIDATIGQVEENFRKAIGSAKSPGGLTP